MWYVMKMHGTHTWHAKGCPTENLLLLYILVHFRQLLRLLRSSCSSFPTSYVPSWPLHHWRRARRMTKCIGGESGVSPVFNALQLKELLLSTLPWLFDQIYTVPDGFSHHLGITFMEKTWFYLWQKWERDKERELITNPFWLNESFKKATQSKKFW